MEDFLPEMLNTLFSPLAIIFIFTGTGWLLTFFLKRVGCVLLSLGMLLFIALGIFPLGPNMLVYLEKQYANNTVGEDIDGIVVLGGSFHTYLSEKHDQSIVTGNIERVLEGIRLNRKYPNAFLVFTGGNGITGKTLPPETDINKRFMNEMGFSENTVIYEDQSTNTYENAVFTKELVQPLAREEWILVTSAYHMPRSMAVFEKAGWEMQPHPTDYRTDLAYNWMPSLQNIHRNLNMADLALHELGGMIIYKLTGKI